jgi:hypothetical protein
VFFLILKKNVLTHFDGTTLKQSLALWFSRKTILKFFFLFLLNEEKHTQPWHVISFPTTKMTHVLSLSLTWRKPI